MEDNRNDYDKFRDQILDKMFEGKTVPVKPEIRDTFKGAPHLNKDVHWMDPRSRRIVPHMCLTPEENSFVAEYNMQMHVNGGKVKHDWVDPNATTDTDEFGNEKKPDSEDKSTEGSK